MKTVGARVDAEDTPVWENCNDTKSAILDPARETGVARVQ